MPDKIVFATPQDVEAAFYEAIERADLEALMQVWAEDEDIICVSPGGQQVSGYAMIRETWRRIFNGGPRLRVTLRPVGSVITPFSAIHSLVEQISFEGDTEGLTPIITSNAYVRGPLGWRMVLHHASEAPEEMIDTDTRFLH
ncbi:MAG TPA: nuclear transport factor 2 family protein [Rhodocyclaceae bacterium]|jgi:hypothetical protein